MIKRLLILFLLPAALAAQSQPEIPSNLFFDVDLVPIVPKFTLSYGARMLTGASSSFSGTGYVTDVNQLPGDITATGIARSYHDGTVYTDSRQTLIDDGTGNGVTVPITPDGNTNHWDYTSGGQVLPNGNIAMNSYTATVADSGGRDQKSRAAYGVEIVVKRDMGTTARFNWDILGGMSVNDINSKLSSAESATIHTLTDTYSLNGEDAPPAPYTAPSHETTTLAGANGQGVVDENGNVVTTTRDTTVLLQLDPLGRTETDTTSNTNVTNYYHLKGAYFTFRAGPSISVPFSDRLRATVSAGAALVYAGTTYTVQQDFQPDTGDPIVSTVQESEANFLPGVYADANLDLVLTDRAGAFIGLAYQNNGSFRQGINDGQVNYSTKVKLNQLTGIRMGLNVRF